MNENVVVTGGCGFIGSHLVELLLGKGYRVNIIDNFSGGNIRNIASIENNSNLTVWNEDIRDL